MQWYGHFQTVNGKNFYGDGKKQAVIVSAVNGARFKKISSSNFFYGKR